MPVCRANKLNLSCRVFPDTLKLFWFASVVDWLYNVMERAAYGKLASSLKMIVAECTLSVAPCQLQVQYIAALCTVLCCAVANHMLRTLADFYCMYCRPMLSWARRLSRSSTTCRRKTRLPPLPLLPFSCCCDALCLARSACAVIQQ